MTLSRHSTSEDETKKAAGSLAAHLRRGDVVALYGELGSGKTRFVKGLCDFFRITEPVTSPTFVLLNRYRGFDKEDRELYVFHFDLYRLERASDVYDLGYEEFLFGDAVCVIEWADRLAELLPENRFDVTMRFGESDHERDITVVPRGTMKERTGE